MFSRSAYFGLIVSCETFQHCLQHASTIKRCDIEVVQTTNTNIVEIRPRRLTSSKETNIIDLLEEGKVCLQWLTRCLPQMCQMFPVLISNKRCMSAAACKILCSNLLGRCGSLLLFFATVCNLRTYRRD